MGCHLVGQAGLVGGSMQCVFGLRLVHFYPWICSFSGGDVVVIDPLEVELWVVGTEVDYVADYQSAY